MVSMFLDIEKMYRKKFIELYERFISDPKDEKLKKIADGMGMFGGPELSKEINLAANGAYKIEIGKMTLEEAKKILEELKKEEEEDKLNIGKIKK